MSTILITGRNGFIGQELIPLLKFNNKIITVIRRPKENIDYNSEEVILTDLCNIKLSHVKNYKIDLIIHLASMVRGRPKDKMKNNIESTKRISFIAASKDIPIIFLSTTNVFFRDSLGSYAESKNISEEILKANNSKIFIIRVPLVIGRNSASMITIQEFYKKYNFFPLLGRQEGKIQPIHISSINNYLVKLVNSPIFENKVVNIIGNKIYNYRDIINSLLKLANKNKFVIIPLQIIYFIAKTFELLKIRFFVSSEELISVNMDKIIEYNKDNNTINVDNNEQILFS